MCAERVESALALNQNKWICIQTMMLHIVCLSVFRWLLQISNAKLTSVSRE